MEFHTRSSDEVLTQLSTQISGLTSKEALQRLQSYGPNQFPDTELPSILKIFLQQFLNPLIYILLAAGVISLVLNNLDDAIFILVILVVNSLLGTWQEFSANKRIQALKQLSNPYSKVKRDNKVMTIDRDRLVPGDIILLESGDKIPADARLIEVNNFQVDESLLTGESFAISKETNVISNPNAVLGDRKNMLFSGSLVTTGRAVAVIVTTGLKTELGKIAKVLQAKGHVKPPLLQRMEQFTSKLSLILLVLLSIMGSFLVFKGEPWIDVLFLTVALAVSAIPEGLPISITVALSIASRKMAGVSVIVRKLPAVEALGSCDYVATDKTGTLTVNQLTITKIILDESTTIDVPGVGLEITYPLSMKEQAISEQVKDLIQTGILCNESYFQKNDSDTDVGSGDAVDVAFNVLAFKALFNPAEVKKANKLVDEIPFESKSLYAASLYQIDSITSLYVKGAVERVSGFCSQMYQNGRLVNIDHQKIDSMALDLANDGFRVLALAIKKDLASDINPREQLNNMIFLGLVGMIDPLRSEAKEAILSCKNAGIKVSMITGDHPKTALAIARELNLAHNDSEVVSGVALKEADPDSKISLIKNGRVFARIDPVQKLEIVQALIKQGHFVAVTGDGANDAAAMKASHVGISMGQNGSDIARESSDLILTDDRFASIVDGIREGRVAYSNIRKVIYLLIATGAAEVLLFIFSFIFNTPIPLTPLQILWLNIVTNGIQDKALAFEPAEGDELYKPPRKTTDAIFDRLMIERVLVSASVMAIGCFVVFYYMLSNEMGSLAELRNAVLLLMVLFQNMMIGNCRSEEKSIFKINLFSNKILLGGAILSQLVHILAMHVGWLQKLLGLNPIPLSQWLIFALIASSVVWVMEGYKQVFVGVTIPKKG
jgi:magnesium-transporting ATPase (P-type)